MNTIGTTPTLAEQFRYAPHMLTEREIYDALQELEAWRATADEFACDDPEEPGEYVDELREKQCTNHDDYDYLREFFKGCVESLNVPWLWAEPYDTDLRDVIMSAIARGDVEEKEE